MKKIGQRKIKGNTLGWKKFGNWRTAKLITGVKLRDNSIPAPSGGGGVKGCAAGTGMRCRIAGAKATGRGKGQQVRLGRGHCGRGRGKRG